MRRFALVLFSLVALGAASGCCVFGAVAAAWVQETCMPPKHRGALGRLIGALPPIHDLARQAGIELPAALGKVEDAEPPRADGGKAGPAAGSD